MSITKHKFINIPIVDQDEFAMEELSIQALNAFLADSNVVYLGHTICIASKDKLLYGSAITKNSHLIMSIVYKDLAGSAADLSKASPKVKEIVRREVAEGEQLAEPAILTDFDKRTKGIESQPGKIEKETKPRKLIKRPRTE